MSEVAPLDEDTLQQLYTWIDEIPLSRPKRNITRDFSDGVLVAEIIKHFIANCVDLHNYSTVNSVVKKKENWSLLSKKVFYKIPFTVEDEHVREIVSCKPGVIEHVLTNLREAINEYFQRKHAEDTLVRQTMQGENEPHEPESFPHPTYPQHQELENYPNYTAFNGGPYYQPLPPPPNYAYQEENKTQELSKSNNLNGPPADKSLNPSPANSNHLSPRSPQVNLEIPAFKKEGSNISNENTKPSENTKPYENRKLTKNTKLDETSAKPQQEGIQRQKSNDSPKKSFGKQTSLTEKPSKKNVPQENNPVKQRHAPSVNAPTNAPTKNKNKATKASPKSEVKNLKLALEEKEQALLASQETIQILQVKIRRLEHLLHLKDLRIGELRGDSNNEPQQKPQQKPHQEPQQKPYQAPQPIYQAYPTYPQHTGGAPSNGGALNGGSIGGQFSQLTPPLPQIARSNYNPHHPQPRFYR